MQLPSTTALLQDTIDSISSYFPNIQKHQIKLRKVKLEFVLNSNRGEDEGTKRTHSIEIALNEGLMMISLLKKKFQEACMLPLIILENEALQTIEGC